VASSSSVDHFKIPVQPGTSGEPTPEEDAVQPLQNKVYSQMPRTLQRMTVKDKVIIITG
jgi:hypothetical protein